MLRNVVECCRMLHVHHTSAVKRSVREVAHVTSTREALGRMNHMAPLEAQSCPCQEGRETGHMTNSTDGHQNKTVGL